MGRGYDQYCPIAHALGVVGERWSLLVVRELQHGPLRYTDLLERLQGCSTNILATRLRELEEGGVIRKEKLPPPAAVTVYSLTPSGAALRPVLRELAWWGIGRLGPPPADFTFDDGGLTRALATATLGTVDGTIEVRVGQAVAHVGPEGIAAGPVAEPDATVQTDAVGLYHLLVEHDSAGATIDGDVGLLSAFLDRLPIAAAGRPD